LSPRVNLVLSYRYRSYEYLGRSPSSAADTIGETVLGQSYDLHLALRPEYARIDDALDYLYDCEEAYDMGDWEWYYENYCDEDEGAALDFLDYQRSLGWRPSPRTAEFLSYVSDELGPAGPSLSIPDSIYNNGLSSRYFFNSGDAFNYEQTTWSPINVRAVSEAVLQSWAHNFSAHMVNEARVGFNRLNVNFGGNNPVGEFNWNFPNYGAGPKDRLWGNYGYLRGALGAGGFGNMTTPIIPGGLDHPYQFQDNWNYILGKHSLKYDLDWNYQRSPNTFLRSINSSWSTLPGSDSYKPIEFGPYGRFNYFGDATDSLDIQYNALNRTIARRQTPSGTIGSYGFPGLGASDAGTSSQSGTCTDDFFSRYDDFFSRYIGVQCGFLRMFSAPAVGLHRELFGFEDTLLDGGASVEVRVPFTGKENPNAWNAGVGGWSLPSVTPFRPYMASGVMLGGKFYGQYVDLGPWSNAPADPNSLWSFGGFSGSSVLGNTITPLAGGANAFGGPGPGTFLLSSTAPGATFVPPPGWKVVTPEEFLNQLAGSAKPSQPPGTTGDNPKTKAEILGPDDLVLRVDAQGRVILARGPWELATLNAAPPFGLESGTAAWMAAPLPDQLPQVNYRLVANGNSSGKAFELQVQDPSGQFKRVVLPDGVVLEPAAMKDPEVKAASETGKLLRQEITAFCLEFAKLPPEVGMLYKIADAEKQRKYRPAHYALDAGYEMGLNGEFNPDMDAKAYIDFTRQNAAWAIQGDWDEQQFTQHWIERTQKNAQAMHIAWSKPMEDALRAAAPNRWRDIDKVVKKARSMMQKEELAAAR
jgi:hypothetical protein